MLLRSVSRRAFACSMTPMRFFAQQKGPTPTKPPSPSSPPPPPPPPAAPKNTNNNNTNNNNTNNNNHTNNNAANNNVANNNNNNNNRAPPPSSSSSSSESWVVDKPTKKPRVGETRTAISAYELYQHAVSNGFDVRLLSEIFRRWVLLLKNDTALESFFVSEFAPSSGADDKFTRVKLTDAQREALSAEKAQVFKDELVPQVFSDILEARGPQELDLFLETYLFMVEHGKTQYLKQFEEEFSRLTAEGFGEMPVTVTTAFELSEEQKALVQAALEKKAVDGAIPMPTYRVNPSIMGGVNINWNMQHEYSATTRSWFEDGLDNLKKGINEQAH